MVFNYRRFTVSYMEWQEWKQLLKLHAMRGTCIMPDIKDDEELSYEYNKLEQAYSRACTKCVPVVEMLSYQDIIRKRLASECVDGGFTSSYYTRDAAIALQIIAYALRGARDFAQCAPLELKLIKHCAGH
jgi:hypothetical protein